MAARKKPTRPLVKILADLMQEINDASFETPEDTPLVQYIRASLVAKGVMLFVDVRDHQILDGQDGSSWAAVDIEITAVEADSGDEVKMSYIGQAVDEASHAYNRAFDQAITQCLLKTLVYVPLPEPEVMVVPELSAPVEAQKEALPEMEVVTQPAREQEPAVAAVDPEAPLKQEVEAIHEDLDSLADTPQEEAPEEPEPEVEPEPEPEEEAASEPAEVSAQEAIVGFSGHPLWQEFWEVLSGEVEASEHERDAFVRRLTQARGVDHLHWLSPEQLQAEVDFLDNVGEPSGYFEDPARELQSTSERFMQSLQSVTGGAQAKAFRDLYLARMGASLLTDVEEKKLSLMIDKLAKFDHDERAGYVEDVLRTEA